MLLFRQLFKILISSWSYILVILHLNYLLLVGNEFVSWFVNTCQVTWIGLCCALPSFFVNCAGLFLLILIFCFLKPLIISDFFVVMQDHLKYDKCVLAQHPT